MTMMIATRHATISIFLRTSIGCLDTRLDPADILKPFTAPAPFTKPFVSPFVMPLVLPLVMPFVRPERCAERPPFVRPLVSPFVSPLVRPLTRPLPMPFTLPGRSLEGGLPVPLVKPLEPGDAGGDVLPWLRSLLRIASLPLSPCARA